MHQSEKVARRFLQDRGNSYALPGLCCAKQNFWFWMKVIIQPHRSYLYSPLPVLLATSAVDLETDKSIQEIIRGPQFKHTTILTIA
jgi:hypothetical protein